MHVQLCTLNLQEMYVKFVGFATCISYDYTNAYSLIAPDYTHPDIDLIYGFIVIHSFARSIVRCPFACPFVHSSQLSVVTVLEISNGHFTVHVLYYVKQNSLG